MSDAGQDALTAKLSPGERRRAVMMWVGAVMLMLAVVGGGAVQTQRWARAEAAKAVPSGGFYWPVAQYQLAYASLKEDLLSTALGRQSDPEALARSWSVLTSRAGVLVEPSEVRTLYERVPGYAQATRRIAELLSRVSPVLDHPPISPADVLRVLEEFKVAGHENILTELDNATRQTELAAQDSLLNGLSNRLGWIWAGFGLSWALLGLWLLNVIQSSRRLAKVSAERETAVRAMEAAIGVKRRFVSMVSHELRSPLQSIVTSAESLSQDLDLVSSRPQSVAAIRRIRTAVAGLRAQLRDLLTIARGDSGQLGTQLETFDCSELVDDVCEDFRELARAKGLQLDVDLPDQSTLVQADPIRIAQVVRNLLENAIRYTASGKVFVKLEVVDAAAPSTPAGASVHLTVADTGPGIPAIIVERMKSADPWRLPTESHELSGPHEGMRIGLLVIHDVICQLGGELVLTTHPGEGTTAKVTIPVTLSGEAVSPKFPDMVPPLEQALNVLVVDDDLEILNALQEAVRRLGHHCDVALSATGAGLLLAQSRYDAVLIDLVMPEKSGLVLAREIREGGGPSASSMLILISSPENLELGPHDPFDGFLEKPIDTPSLRRVIGSSMPQ